MRERIGMGSRPSNKHQKRQMYDEVDVRANHLSNWICKQVAHKGIGTIGCPCKIGEGDKLYKVLHETVYFD
jgi:hypothetical protein